MEGPFTFETLSSQEAQEKKSRALIKIESSFYRHLAGYISGLEDACRKEQERNPTSKKLALLFDELRNAQNKADELWKAREKKIVAFAQVNARKDASPPPENLTRDEAEFYHNLVTLLRDQWRRLMPSREAVSSKTPTPPSPPKPVAAAAPAPAPSAAPVLAVASAAVPAAAELKDEVQTIRALVDIPPFVGFDGKTYRIKKGEVLSLPKKFAKILKDRNQAALVG